PPRRLAGGRVPGAAHESAPHADVVSREPRGEIVVATGRDLSVAIDTELDDALIVEGVARELVAALQRLRRETALDVTDRVRVHWSSSDPAVRSAFAAHADLIAGEVLAVSIEEDGAGTEVDLVGHPVTLTVNRA
ncbi:MAG: DUF5915 domain-containing protein, partial [Acidimicrobiia bacterium]